MRIYLSRLENAGGTVEASQDVLVPDGIGQEVILVVEDDEAVRESTVDSLQELGYQVVAAEDGPTGLRLLQETRKIDLLFTDVVLPGGMTGAELAAKARGLRPGPKVLFTTGYARNAIVHQSRLDRGVQLLTKPYTFADLGARIRDVLDMPG